MMGYNDIASFAGSSEELDKAIEWKAGSIKVLKHYKMDTITRGAHMQRQFTIELRVDFADSEKLGPLTQTLRQAARHAFATAQLISDNPKTTQIAVYSEDFFSGHEEIKLLDDVIAQGLNDTNQTEGEGDNGVSSELATAATNNAT